MFFPALLIFAAVSLLLFWGGDALYSFLSALLAQITARFGWLYLWIYIVNFVFLGWLAFSKYGRIKFGKADEKPEYSNFSWTCMVFTTGIDASIMIMTLFEPVQYVSAPPFGLQPFSPEAYDYAHMYGQFHWGPSAWTMYIPATIAIAYTLYVKHTDTTRISNACAPASRRLCRHKWMRNLLDVVIVFGIMGGIGASIGLEIPVISRIFHQITGVADTLGLKFAMLAVLLALFGSSVYLGLEKGMKWLSSATVYITLGLLAVTLLWGPTSYLIDSETNSIGLLVSNFVRMSTYTDPNLASGFPQNWTIFYWGWWLAYMPVMGLFVARISRGRTIRQVICGQVLWGSVGCMTVFGIMGGYALYIQKTGIADLAGILETQGQEAAIAAVIGTLPLPQIMLVVYLISCFVFLATTISSSAFILSSMTSRRLTGYEAPARWNRLLWSVVFMLFSAGIMVVGGLETIKLVCVLAGFPLIAVVIVLMRAIVRMVKENGAPGTTDAQTAPHRAEEAPPG
ncbi:MAG: glycine/betaine ABC transporter [Oscillospiraceae bacterium]|nr:MAG: glycine/betaine ABC transporter [Oscillospiraceae bacterium]